MSWRGADGFTRWHIERLTYPHNVLCPATAPLGVRFSRRPDVTGPDICKTCLAMLDKQTADAVKMSP